MKKYVFIANSTKPAPEQLVSREKINLSNNYRLHVEAARAMGYDVFVGVNRLDPEELESNLGVKLYYSSTYRSLFDIKSNYTAYQNLLSLLKKEKIDVVHCNTPIGGLIGRWCAKRAGVPKVIYTVHGFHFYKGAPLINRTLFKWAEMWLSHHTDAIITINREDFETAQKLRLRKNGKIYYIPGVGINTEKIATTLSKRDVLLKEIGAEDSSILLISTGDLNFNKNNEVIIKALATLRNPQIHYILCGIGKQRDKLSDLALMNDLGGNVHFMGYRSDIAELLKSCDIFVLPSFREGLPRSMMEAMAAGLPCVGSRIRGNIDLIKESRGGYLCQPDDINGFAHRIRSLAEDEQLRKNMGEYNLKVVKEFDTENVKKETGKIYAAELA